MLLFLAGQCQSAPWLCVAPLNAAIYNASPANLAAHGLHPRATHILLNLPLLALPLYLVAAADAYMRVSADAIAVTASVGLRLRSLLLGGLHHGTDASARLIKLQQRPSQPRRQDEQSILSRLCRWLVLLPLVALSSSPHQVGCHRRLGCAPRELPRTVMRYRASYCNAQPSCVFWPSPLPIWKVGIWFMC